MQIRNGNLDQVIHVWLRDARQAYVRDIQRRQDDVLAAYREKSIRRQEQEGGVTHAYRQLREARPHALQMLRDPMAGQITAGPMAIDRVATQAWSKIHAGNIGGTDRDDRVKHFMERHDSFLAVHPAYQVPPHNGAEVQRAL